MTAKIGEGHLAAMVRLGLKELRDAFNPPRQERYQFGNRDIQIIDTRRNRRNVEWTGGRHIDAFPRRRRPWNLLGNFLI
jgi:hypothetical protein